jgi:hypothetical protein
MTKKEKVEQEIVKVEKELERLKLLLHPTVRGSALEVCPDCKTKNRHWYTKDYWCCAFC